jgi:phosphoribosyl-ATP pyrophosphohydrolase
MSIDMANEFGYHTVEITKGVLGQSSKIQEELDELKDAEKQGVKILIHCELADLYGALRVYAATYGLTMEDLAAMAALTERAFEQEYR